MIPAGVLSVGDLTACRCRGGVCSDRREGAFDPIGCEACESTPRREPCITAATLEALQVHGIPDLDAARRAMVSFVCPICQSIAAVTADDEGARLWQADTIGWTCCSPAPVYVIGAQMVAIR